MEFSEYWNLLYRRPSGIIGISRILGILGILPYLYRDESKDLYGISRIFGIMRIFGIFRILKFKSKFCYRRPSGIMGISRILGILGILAYLFGFFRILDRLNHIEINMQWNNGQSNSGLLDWHP